MKRRPSKERHNLILGLVFLAPNILGFLTFTVLPLVFSLVLAFSNWDLKLHNMFKDEQIHFVFMKNFVRLFREADFYQFFGNTLFFMMAIPLGMAGSLGAALLLSKDMTGGDLKVKHWLLASGVLFVSVLMLTVTGLQVSALAILLSGLAGLLLLGGITGGSTVYRTVFFIPHFTSGVAVYILWKKLYNPSNGPINVALGSPLTLLSGMVNALSPWVVRGGLWLAFALMVLITLTALHRLMRLSRDGSLGTLAAILPAAMLLFPVTFGIAVCPARGMALAGGAIVYVLGCWIVLRECLHGREFEAPPGKGFGDAFMMALVLMALQLVFLGLGTVCHYLPVWAVDGLEAPPWLADYYWAKPAIMMMGLWGSIGSNNMLLYLAGLSNIPTELYEAADIDGASRFQRFWHVTWPQLAPVTFFIFIMSVIQGLQGGFEMARTMTNGGPAGSTTTLSYFIYNEGFSTGRLGYASAIAWTLFAMVFTVTMFNWKFGSRYVND